NIAFIEELYERYRANPDSVSASWREFFGEYHDGGAAAPATGPPAETARPRAGAPTPAAAKPMPVPAPEGKATPLRGAAAKIVSNMEASLAVPTATSVRTIPVKVLEENRRVINNHLAGN